MKLAGILCLTAIGAVLTTPAVAGSRPVVVELFTSQGCSSCPPADALLGRLSQRHGLIAMSLPITYWDMLGWKDTLATATNTRRQKAYAAAMGHGGVYTPQIIIDGVTDVVGSRDVDVETAIAKRMAEIEVSRAEGEVRLAEREAEMAAREAEISAQKATAAAVQTASESASESATESSREAVREAVREAREEAREARETARVQLVEARGQLAAERREISESMHSEKLPSSLAVPVSVTETPHAMHIEVGANDEKSEGPATVWVFHLRNTVTVNIGSGENEGRAMTYHNVVADLRSVGEWNGDAASFEIPRETFQDTPHDAVAVVVQHAGYGRVVGATLLSHPDYEASH